MVRTLAVVAGMSVLVTACGPDASTNRDWTWWDSYAGGGAAFEVERFSTLEEMTEAADVVLEGAISDVVPGRSIPGLPADDRVGYALVTIQVDRVIRRSDADLPGEYRVEFLVTGDDWNTIRDSMIGTQGLFFLRNKGEEARRLGLPDHVVDAERPYFRLVSSQGLILDRSGTAFVPMGDPDDALVRSLSGGPYPHIETRG